MSNLSELLPAGAGAKSATFVATGTIGNGVTVVLNSNGTVEAVSGGSGSTGSETVFASATTRYVSSAYDTNENRVVIAYADNGNSQYGTAIVGTVSGTSITFGTEVVFETAEVQDVSATFDSNANKVVIAYSDAGNSYYGTAIVGTVSGTSISFGTPVVFAAIYAVTMASTFDSTSNKIVIGYRDVSNSYYGTAIIGTVSGTSISFGTAVVFETANSQPIQLVFDPSSNKIVVVYRDQGNSNYGTAIIGTVSGTSITFGTVTVFVSANATYISNPIIDTDNNKVIVFYQDGGNSNYGTAIVGTVSGTSISFGTAAVFNTGSTALWTGAAYNPTIQKLVIAYRDDGDSNIGKYNTGTVSGTDIVFLGEVAFNSGRADNISLVYDPDSTNFVLSFEDNANSSYGTSIVFTPSTTNLTATNFLGISDAAISSAATGTIVVQGGVNSKVTGLTIGTDYYVQANGTLSTTTSTVPAGRALSTTSILLEG
jgi:hypothetical protein